MNDLVLVALISAGAPALVSVAAAVASIFGPVWRERVQRADERAAAQSDVRYERAVDFVESLAKLSSAKYEHEVRAVHAARNRFVATLRAGEGAVEVFTSEALRQLGNKQPNRLFIVNSVSDQVFGWLRGDLKASDLRLVVDEKSPENEAN